VAADREYLDRPTVGRTLYYLALTALFVTGAADLQRPVQRIPANARPSLLNDDKAARASSAAGR
jgi:hypothetical protein